MSYNVNATARKGFLVGYFCEQCGKFCVEQGSVEGHAVVTTTFSPKPGDQEKARADAQADALNVYKTLRIQVNDLHRFDQLRVNGICTSCHTRQMWSVRPMPEEHEKKFFILGGVSAALGALMGLLARNFWLYLIPGIALCVADVFIGLKLKTAIADNLADDHTRRVEAACRDKEHNCLPFVMAPGESVKGADERSALLGLILHQAQS